jgi:hypothetical protein
MRLLMAVALSLLAVPGSVTTSAYAEEVRGLSIRMTAFEVNAADRVAEIEAAMAEPEPRDEEATARLFKLMLAAERGDAAAIAQLKQKVLEGKARFETEKPGEPVSARSHRDRRIWNATRGMEPQVAIDCVAAEGETVEVPAWIAGLENWKTYTFRLERIGGARALIEISEELGSNALGPISWGTTGVAHQYLLDAPHVSQMAGGNTPVRSFGLGFLELQRVPYAPRGSSCSVHYGPGHEPPPGVRTHPAAMAPSEPLER